ncbi:MAG: flagellar hook-basal body complex protein FliE [Salinarimonadaceae bacterium]|nr:MAG: flagellar hook-basal body complex protein FliE [Salinarimonadaceae bacterium]
MMNAVASLQNITALPSAGALGAAGGVERAASAAITSFPQGAPRVDFSEILSQVATNGIESMQRAEAASIMGLQGQASVQQVVEAVMSAEQSLQTAIAVRDKVVAAYQEISRMAI